MNIGFLLAGALLLVLGIGHTLRGEWIGDRVLVRKIFELGLFEDRETDLLAKRIVRVAWHLTSILWCGMAALLFTLATFDTELSARITAGIIAVTCFVGAVFSLAVARGRHPSWLLLLSISVACLAGSL